MAKSKLKTTDTLGKMDAKQLAEMLRRKGRGRDTVLAHITPREARKLKEMGGSGTINPETGLPEFQEDFGGYDISQYGDFTSPDFQSVLDTYSGDYGATPEAYDTSGYFYEPVQQADYAAPEGGYYQPVTGFDYTASQADLPSFGAYEVGGQAPAGQGFLPPLVGTPANVPVPLSRADVFGGAQYPVSEAAAEERPMTAEEKAAEAAKSEESKGYLERLFGKLDLGTLARLGLAGGAAMMGRRQQQQGIQQAQRAADALKGAYGTAAQDIRALAAPIQGPAITALTQAQQGALDPARLRQIEIERARLAQATAKTGGVGAIQSAEAMNRARQDALTAQQAAAVAMLGQANPLLSQAIQAQLQGTTQGLQYNLQLQQQANQAAANLYGQLGRYMAG